MKTASLATSDRGWALACVALLLALPSGEVWGATITVANPGFETPTLADGTGSFVLSAWSPNNANVAGTFNPAVTDYPAEAPEGLNVAFVNGNGNFIFQNLSGEFVTADAVYTLEVDVGRRLGLPGSDWSYSVDLIVANTTGPSGILAQDFSLLSPAAGQFLTSTVTYTAPSSGPVIGQPLAIRLRSWGSEQVNFDDVRLTVVPEPGSLLLLACGLVALRAARKRSTVAGGPAK